MRNKINFFVNRKRILGFNNIQIFLIFGYIVCWLSISTTFKDISYLFYVSPNELGEHLYLSDIINFLRQLLNTIIFPILIGILILNIKKINFKKEILFILVFFYFLMQIPGLYLTNNSLMNFVFIISAFNILFILILANIYFDKEKYFVFFNVIFLMLFLILVLNYNAYIYFLTSEGGSSLYTFFNISESFFLKASPRSTGSSRSFLFIMIISFYIFHNFFQKNNHFKIIIYILISVLILLFQSRTTLTLLFIFIMINYIFEQNFSLKALIKYMIIYLLLPLVVMYLILVLKQFVHDPNFMYLKINPTEVSENFKRPIDPNTYTSGRFNDWKNILSKVNSSIIYGYGAQGDRFLINQTASNGLLYAMSSSGILGIISFIFFSLLSLWTTYKIFLKSFRKSNETYYCATIVLLILLRSILESSYAVFGIDFIVLVTLANYLNKFCLK